MNVGSSTSHKKTLYLTTLRPKIHRTKDDLKGHEMSLMKHISETYLSYKAESQNFLDPVLAKPES